MTFLSKHISVTISRDPKDVYAFASNPEHLPRWAAGLGSSDLLLVNGEWISNSPMGRIKIKFVPVNAFGVMDHWVTLPDGAEVLNPMRVLPNGLGSEVIFSMFQLEGITDEMFQRDAELVEKDLLTLKRCLESK